MPKLPRVWRHESANVLNTRDDTIFLFNNVNPGQSVVRIRFHYRIMGRTNESDMEVPFDAYYVGVALVSSLANPADLNAWADRDTVDWMWWEGAHFTPVNGTGTPGQTWLFYPRSDYERDCHAQRHWQGAVAGSVIFSFARSGGVVLTEQRVNVVASILLLG